MRNVVYVTSMSVDGYIEAANGDQSWVVPDEELHRHFNAMEHAFDMHLYGRRFYELMAAYWPTADDNPAAPAYGVEYARIWKSVPKVVFSKTLERVNWNARLVNGNAPEEVARLKAQLGKDMSIGGTTLASSLAAAGLIDEYRLYVVPIVLGAGTRMFQHVNVPINLAPVETLEFTSGVILLKYRHQRETRLAI